MAPGSRFRPGPKGNTHTDSISAFKTSSKVSIYELTKIQCTVNEEIVMV